MIDKDNDTKLRQSYTTSILSDIQDRPQNPTCCRNQGSSIPTGSAERMQPGSRDHLMSILVSTRQKERMIINLDEFSRSGLEGNTHHVVEQVNRKEYTPDGRRCEDATLLNLSVKDSSSV